MSHLRPTLVNGKPCEPVLRNGTAYLCIYEAVRRSPGLLHGHLNDDHGEHCAVGRYFAPGHQPCLPSALVDEVAAVNDSVPDKTPPKQRRLFVLRWLRWRLRQADMPGFRGAREPKR